MASIEALKDALAQTLEARGVLGRLKAQVRAEIFTALEDPNEPPPSTLSNENLVINELIREYFQYNGYESALSVFLAESGQPSGPGASVLDRAFLAQELLRGAPETEESGKLPLLYSVVSQLRGTGAAAGGDSAGAAGGDGTGAAAGADEGGSPTGGTDDDDEYGDDDFDDDGSDEGKAAAAGGGGGIAFEN